MTNYTDNTGTQIITSNSPQTKTYSKGMIRINRVR